MAAVLRSISSRSKFLLSLSRYHISFFPKKNPISLSLRTMPWENMASSKIGGWEFSYRKVIRDDFFSWRMDQRSLPISVNDRTEIVIKHVGSNIAFRFSGYDAIIKHLQEKETRSPLGSDIPSYASPLLPVCEHQYDSAFVGRVFMEKPGEEAKYINPTWEDIDRETLYEQIVWKTKHERLSGVPKNISAVCGRRENSFIKFEGKKMRPKNGVLHPLCNYMCCLYKNEGGFDQNGNSCSYFHLVITNYGWFVYLYQLHFYHTFFGQSVNLERIRREMTMQCNFDENIIFREISERLCKDFKNKLPKEEEMREDDKMLLYFHETKQLRIEEIDMENVSVTSTDNVVRPYSPFITCEGQPEKLYNVVELKTPPLVDSMSFVELEVPEYTIDSAFGNYKDPIQNIEDIIGTPVRIIPLFRHPCNPKLCHNKFRSGVMRRKLYTRVSNE